MGFSPVLFNGFGRGMFGAIRPGWPQAITTFIPPALPDNHVEIEFVTPQGTSFGPISSEVQRPILSDLEYRYGEEGGIDWKATFTQQPEGVLVRFTEFIIRIAGIRRFWGYVWDSPGAQKDVRMPFQYSGFGMGKILEKVNIALKTGVNIYQISEIETSGSNAYVTTLEGLATEDVVGCVAIVKDAESEDNDGRFDITGVDAGRIVFVNPTAEAQSLTVGLLYILPREWSELTTTVSELVAQVVRDYAGEQPIFNVDDLIEETPDDLTATVVDLDGMPLLDFFNFIRDLMPDWLLYVDEDKFVKLARRPTSPVAYAVTGYDLNDIDERVNDDDVVNRWIVNRKQGKEERRVGFIEGGRADDPTSQARHGVIEKELDVPVYTGEALSTALAEAVLSQTKDPKTTMVVKNVPLKWYPIGPWEIITAPVRRESVLCDCETTAGWTVDAEIGLATDDDDAIEGAASLVASYSFAAVFNEAEIRFPCDFVLLDPETLVVWYRGSRIGQRVRFCYGETSWNEDPSRFVEFEVFSGQWKPLVVDISGATIRRIGEIGFQFLDSVSGSESTGAFGISTHGRPLDWLTPLGDDDVFHFDRITVMSVSAETRTLNLTQVRGHKRDDVCELTFGPVTEGLDKFLAKQMRSLVSARLALKER